MIRVMDYSARRGVIVPLLPAVHALLTENAEKDPLAGLKPPAHIILWRQTMNNALLDIHRRWLFAMDDTKVAGVMFYRLENGQDLYLHELQITWAYRNDPAVISLLLEKFQFDREVSACRRFFAGERIKIEPSKELLASVGFKDTYPDGWQPLGTLLDTVNALKLRYGS